MNNAFDVITSRMDTAEEKYQSSWRYVDRNSQNEMSRWKRKKNVEQYSGTMGKLWKM